MSFTDVDGSLRVLGAREVESLLAGQEADVLRAVEQAYLAHYRGQSSLPHSSFLRFPGDAPNRIISLPAYLGGPFQVAGIKWIASFPGNTAHGLPRASATIVLNDLRTGLPTALLEGGSISAKRTAAGAALAAKLLHTEADPTEVSLLGTGRINGEVLSFLRAVFPRLSKAYVYDSVPANAERFAGENSAPDLALRVLERPEHALRAARLVSIATTAPAPHLEDDGTWGEGSTVLHLSLRDLHPATILRSINVVDDVDHAIRERTSLHLTETREGHRRFVAGTLEPALEGRESLRRGDPRPLIFSPFGLGVLDLAVAKLVLSRAEEHGHEIRIPNFSLP